MIPDEILDHIRKLWMGGREPLQGAAGAAVLFGMLLLSLAIACSGPTTARWAVARWACSEVAGQDYDGCVTREYHRQMSANPRPLGFKADR